MKTTAAILWLVILGAFGANAQDNAPLPGKRPTIALMDVYSTYYDAGKRSLLTDVIRSELFRTQLFRIMERGVIQKALEEKKIGSGGTVPDSQILQLGKALDAEKIFICTLEKFSDTIAFNIRVVDVATSYIDYTENIFIKNENLLFDAIKELVTKVELRYSSGKQDNVNMTPEGRAIWLMATWKFLGAQGKDLDFLLASREDPETFLTLRQYDISLTAEQFVVARQGGWDLNVIKTFLQSGISYPLTEKAIRLGLTKLDKYRQVFQPANLTFEQYLDAYENKLNTVEAYNDYAMGFKKDFFLFGGGGAADNFPIANAVFKFFLGQISWEHYWTRSLRDNFRVSTEAGLFLMNMVAPTPYMDLNFYAGQKPFYVKVGIGGHAEVILGGHFGLHGRLGLEVAERFEVTFMAVPFGTQPRVSYTDLKTPVGADGSGGIVFPYYSVMFTYKLPAPDHLSW